MKIFLEFKTVSVTTSGDYYQVLFHDDLDTEDEPYFMIQRQFEFPNSDVCHFESDKEDLIEQCTAGSASLSSNTLRLLYGSRTQRRDVEIKFSLYDADIHELASALQEIIPEITIEIFT